MGWKQVGAPKVDITWDEEKFVEGIYRGGRDVTTSYGEGTIHTIEVDGEPQTFFAPTQLNQRLEDVSVGDYIRIHYTAKVRKSEKGRDVKQFYVYVQTEDTAGDDIAPPSAAPAPQAAVGRAGGAPPSSQTAPAHPSPSSPAASPSDAGLPPWPQTLDLLKRQCKEYITVLRLPDERAKEIWRIVGTHLGTEDDWKRYFIVLYSMNNGMLQGAAIIEALKSITKEAPAEEEDVPF